MTQEEFQKTVLNELKGLREDVTGLKEGVGGLKGDVGGLKEDVAGLKGDVRALKEEQKQLISRVGALEKGQKELTSKVGALEKGQKELTRKVDIMDKKIDIIYDQIACLTEFKEKITKDIETNKADNEVLKEMVARHEIEIKSLEKRIG
ncbi:MAG TPA: hypothetical protein VK071_07985 [Tissierellales bacterium]|nr:hypothetical protein [Tissierellales bacterium]